MSQSLSTTRLTCMAVALLAGQLCGCSVASGPAGTSTPPADCSSGSIPGYTEVTAFQKCTMCHSSSLGENARNHAPTELNFDSYAGASEVAPEMVQQVTDGRMPPPASNIRLTDAEKQQLLQWAQCGTKP